MSVWLTTCVKAAVSRATFTARYITTHRLMEGGGCISGGEVVGVESENKLGRCGAVQFRGEAMGLVVLQEWWGLNTQIQEEAKLLANLGPFITIVPDLYRGKKTDDREEAGHLMGGLDWKGALDDIQGCARHLKNIGCKKVGVMGFCMGGALSLSALQKVPEIDAAAPFYGIPGDLDASKISKPLQCHFGDQDEIEGFSDVKAQEKLKEKLKAAKVDFEFFSYPAKHAFTNHSSPNYNKEACEASFKRAVDFFRKHLGGIN